VEEKPAREYSPEQVTRFITDRKEKKPTKVVELTYPVNRSADENPQ
jgi:hypothetical protein